MAKNGNITYKDLYDLVDGKMEKLEKRLESIETVQSQQNAKLASMEGQAKMVPFLVSVAINVVFFFVGMFKRP